MRRYRIQARLGGIPLRTPAARIAVVVTLLAGALGCESRAVPSPTSPTSFSGATDLNFCVDEINRYRGTIGRPGLARSPALEENATAAAEYDATARVPHAYFATPFRLPAVSAETAILWWSGYDVRAVIQKGLAQMWASGPKTEHYEVLSGAFTQVGCGVFVKGSEVTVVQDFR